MLEPVGKTAGVVVLPTTEAVGDVKLSGETSEDERKTVPELASVAMLPNADGPASELLGLPPFDAVGT